MMSLDDDRGAQRVWGYLATGNYFESLGIQPALGRFFTTAEDLHPNASPYAVISHACWQSRFGGDPRIAGKDIRINSHPYTVLGVAPRAFHGTEVFYWSEIWVPMTMQPQIEGHSWLEARNTYNSWVAGRLKPGVTVQQAEANLGVIAAQLAREYTSNEGMRLTLGVPGMMGSAGREPIRAFAGGVMLLAAPALLAACANLASLLAGSCGNCSQSRFGSPCSAAPRDARSPQFYCGFSASGTRRWDFRSSSMSRRTGASSFSPARRRSPQVSYSASAQPGMLGRPTPLSI